MHYLMYFKDGFMRKFPLERPSMSIGRGSDNDLVLSDPSISRHHCKVELDGDVLKIRDLHSRNGLFVGKRQVGEATLHLNTSFFAGDVEFFFKRGEVHEFQLSPELASIMSFKAPSRQKRGNDELTRDSESKYGVVLRMAAEKAILAENLSAFLQVLGEELSLLSFPGALFHSGPDNSVFLFNALPQPIRDCTKHFGTGPHPTAGSFDWHGTTVHARRYPIGDDPAEWALVHISEKEEILDKPTMVTFLRRLCEILLSRRQMIPCEAPPAVPRDSTLFRGETVCIIGRSPAMKKLVDVVRRIAPKKSFVLVLGENGTGKELVAKMIHELSGRKQYVAVNCAAIPANLLESELFGYEAGAFTDARKRRVGKLEQASGGTLVLDEIGDMPQELQAKLLRAIQEKSLTRLGGNDAIPLDVRIVSLTNRDIYRHVEEGGFREDLFFRLRVHELVIPPLRERPEDIDALIAHFAAVYAKINNIHHGGFSKSAHRCLLQYPWRGNVRELENEISRIMEIIDDQEMIGSHHILPSIACRCPDSEEPTAPPAGEALRQRKDEMEREAIASLLQQLGGNKSQASRSLGMSYQGFLKKLKRLGL